MSRLIEIVQLMVPILTCCLSWIRFVEFATNHLANSCKVIQVGQIDVQLDHLI